MNPQECTQLRAKVSSGYRGVILRVFGAILTVIVVGMGVTALYLSFKEKKKLGMSIFGMLGLTVLIGIALIGSGQYLVDQKDLALKRINELGTEGINCLGGGANTPTLSNAKKFKI